MTNSNLTSRRARSWAKDRNPETGKKLTHERNRREQEARARDNRALRASGLPTPWEVARAQRVQRRAELREARRRAA